MHTNLIIRKHKYIHLNISKHIAKVEIRTTSQGTKHNTQIYVVHPHPRATSTNSSSILSSSNQLQEQSRKNPYFVQDRRSVQPARSFFLSFQHKVFYIFTRGLALSSTSLYKMHKTLDHTNPFLELSLYHIDTIQSSPTRCLCVYLYIQSGQVE
jgi:hypothetical protein